MGKRSNFARKPRDAYDTPYSPAIPALLPHLPAACYFIEPCAGRGWLIEHLEKHGHTCVYAADIEPRGMHDRIKRQSVHQLRLKVRSGKARFITNPPFDDAHLFPILQHLAPLGEVWFLLPADNMHNKNMAEYLRVYGRKIVTIGRISWEQNGTTGKENYAWYLFDGTKPPSPTQFIERRD